MARKWDSLPIRTIFGELVLQVTRTYWHIFSPEREFEESLGGGLFFVPEDADEVINHFFVPPWLVACEPTNIIDATVLFSFVLPE